MLGLAAKAGKLVYGCNLTCDKVRSGGQSPYLILIAADASENTKKRITNCCIYYERIYKFLPPSIGCAELARATGRRGPISCVGVNDKGFSEALVKLTNDYESNTNAIQQEVDAYYGKYEI